MCQVEDVFQEDIIAVLSQPRSWTRPEEKAKPNREGSSGIKNTSG